PNAVKSNQSGPVRLLTVDLTLRVRKPPHAEREVYPLRPRALLPGGLGRLAAVPAEGPGRRELAELVPDHILGHIQLHECLAVVDRKVLADELGHDRAGPRPGLDRLAVASLVGLVHP